jgi:ATP-binding cassette subfamily B protein
MVSPIVPYSSARKTTRFWVAIASTPRLLRLVWHADPGYCGATATITLLQALLPALQLYVAKLVVDTILINAAKPSGSSIDWSIIAFLLSLRLGLSLLSEGFNQVSSYTLQILKDRFALYANRCLIDHAIRLDLSHYEQSRFPPLIKQRPVLLCFLGSQKDLHHP